jgi:hypothetical protein
MTASPRNRWKGWTINTVIGAALGLAATVVLALGMIGAALTFVIGRWCARVLGWY